jgi:uncharacterized protein (TIGR02001 family)
MKIQSKLLVKAVLLGSVLAGVASVNVARAEEEKPFLTVSGTVGVYSDYRYRGASLNNKNPVVQGGITLTTAPGLYVGVWGSPADAAGGTEIDVTAGYSTTLGELVTVDGGIVGYLYPNDAQLGFGQLDYYELYASVSGTVGIFTPKLGINWGPSQKGIANGCTDCTGKRDNFYIYGNLTAGIPETPVKLSATLGYESGGFDYNPRGGKVDWSIGATADILGLTFGVSYIDSDAPATINGKGKDVTKGTILVSLVKAF